MDLDTFQSLPIEEVARLVRERGPKVCVFPINGTRRWFMLEHPDLATADFVDAYLQIGGRRHVELYQMFFDHGVDTLLTPVFGPDLLERGDEYMQLAVRALLWFTHNPVFLDFYDAYDVRVRVYGDAGRYFQDTLYAHVLDAFDQITQRTAAHQRRRLFFGVCAHDAAETIAEIGVHFHREHGCLPDKRQIVESYYGEYVEPVALFIGFADRPAVFDMPLIATGNESLYFTVSPSLYMDTATLRAILYDHLYTRRVDEAGYEKLAPEDWQAVSEFYVLNRRNVLGLGRQHASGSFWYPLPQVELPQLWRMTR
jgi:tuberculosinol/isotuberculosinol synthase